MDALNLSLPQKMHVAVPANMQCGLASDAFDGKQELSPLASDMWAPVYRRYGVPEVQVDWLRSNMNKRYRLIDVRNPSEFTGPLGHITGAELVPLATLSSVSVAWDPEQPVILICHSGKRSGRGATLLEQKGFEKVASLVGGMVAWTSTSSSCG